VRCATVEILHFCSLCFNQTHLYFHILNLVHSESSIQCSFRNFTTSLLNNVITLTNTESLGTVVIGIALSVGILALLTGLALFLFLVLKPRHTYELVKT